jgi:putative toxin-antitoxin system antitoxin component (TIGR02293 family)
MKVAMAQVIDLLGGKNVIRRHVGSESEMKKLIEHGLPGQSLRALGLRLELTNKELGDAVLIPERTLIARQKRATLPVDESDRVFRLARLVASTFAAFDNPEKARRWLRKPNRSLGGQTPLDAGRTSAGERQVEDALGRIMYGTIG